MIWDEEMGVATTAVGDVGAVTSGVGGMTFWRLTVTVVALVVLPAASLAMAPIVWLPLATPVVVQVPV